MFLFGFGVKSQAPIALTGHYLGMNICVQNTKAHSGIGYSIFTVKVNGEVTTDEINKEYFIIDFTNLKLKKGDPLTIQIYYTNGDLPKVLNPLVIQPKSTFEIVDTHIEEDVFSWTTINENGSLLFFVEQYRWNKWVKIGEVNGIGTSEKNTYEFKIIPHHGENKFRVSQRDYTYKLRRSETVVYERMDLPEIQITNIGGYNPIIRFSSETYYEVYDFNGNFLIKGFGTFVDLSSFEAVSRKAIVYVNYGNKIDIWNYN